MHSVYNNFNINEQKATQRRGRAERCCEPYEPYAKHDLSSKTISTTLLYLSRIISQPAGDCHVIMAYVMWALSYCHDMYYAFGATESRNGIINAVRILIPKLIKTRTTCVASKRPYRIAMTMRSMMMMMNMMMTIY